MDFQIIWDFLTNPLRRARNIGDNVIEWGQEYLIITAHHFQLAFLLELFGFVTGLLIQKWWANGSSFGNFLLHVCSVAAFVTYLFGWARLAIITEAAIGANKLATEASAQATGERVKFPQLIDEAKGKHLLHAVLGGMLALSGAASYAAIFPAYKNLTDFLGVVILATFCIMMVNYFNMPDMFKIKRKLVILAFVMILVKTAGLVIPHSESIVREIKNSAEYQIDTTVEGHTETRESSRSMAPQLNKKVADLNADRRRILNSHGGLSDADRDRLEDIKDQIAELKSGDLVNDSSFSLTSFFGGSTKMIILVLLLGAVVFVILK